MDNTIGESTMENDESTISSKMSDVSVPPQLKFLMNNVKMILNTQLSADNYPVWKSQIGKLFVASGFDGYLDGTVEKPPKHIVNEQGNVSLNPLYKTWMLIDQNLSAALYSTISSSLLPYVLNLESSAEIWKTMEKRLQSTNRSRILQVKNELHHISMGEKTMMQYLSEIKGKCDTIAASGTPLNAEDIILYTLNGLPSSYNAFKTAIRTNLNPISLDDLYSLLCSEELNIMADQMKEKAVIAGPDQHIALAVRGRGRTRGYSRPYDRGRFQGSNPRWTDRNVQRTKPNSNIIQCQICSKLGHSAAKCWYRMDNRVQPNQSAMYAGSGNSNAEWILDSGATSHMTNDPSNLVQPQPYSGNQQVAIGNGELIPITQTGEGIISTENRPDEQFHPPPRTPFQRPI